MTANNLTVSQRPAVASPEVAQQIKQCLPAFSAQRLKSQAEIDETVEAIAYLSKPAPVEWITGRVVTLLSHYFVAQLEAGQAKAVARDWIETLETYPAWAIAKACRWWLSMENPRKSFKPVPGDIQDRAHRELEGVRAARVMVSMGVCVPTDRQEPPEARKIAPETAEERAAFAASLGLKKIDPA